MELDQLKLPMRYVDTAKQLVFVPPEVEIKIAGTIIDPREHLISLEVEKLPGGCYKFAIELFDGTFTIDEAVLTYQPSIELKYSNRNGRAHYTGKILNSAGTVVLSKGVTISMNGILFSSTMTSDKARSFPSKTYKGSVKSILAKVAKDENLDFIWRDDVSDYAITDETGEQDVISDSTETTIAFIDRMVQKLGESVGFSLLPPNPTMKSNKGTLFVYLTNNSYTGKSSYSSKLDVDINHRNTNVATYEFNIKQAQFDKYGAIEVMTSVNKYSNAIMNNTASVRTSEIDNQAQEIINSSLEKIRRYNVSSGTSSEQTQKLKNRKSKKVEAMYECTIELIEGYPDLLPFATDVNVRSWISSPTSKNSNALHHTSGVYTLRRCIDRISGGRLSTTLDLFKAPGTAVPGTVAKDKLAPYDSGLDNRSKLSKTKYPCLELNKAYEWLTFDHPEDKVNLDPILIGRLGAMAKANNRKMNIYSGYRSTSKQTTLYKNSSGKLVNGKWVGGSGYVAPPGSSWHEYALAVDIGTDYYKNLEKDAKTSSQAVWKTYGLFKPMTKGNGTKVVESWHVQPLETVGVKDKSSLQPAGIVG